MKKRRKMVLPLNISKPVKTKASAKIPNHSIQFITFKETQMIKEAYSSKQESLISLSHSKFHNSDNNIENYGNVIKTTTISETIHTSHKMQWHSNRSQSSQDCILEKDVILPAMEIKSSKERRLVNGNKNNTYESILCQEQHNKREETVLNNKIYESSKKQFVSRESHVQNTSVIRGSCSVLVTDEMSNIKENLNREKNEVSIISAARSAFQEKNEGKFNKSDTEEYSKMVENEKVLKIRTQNIEHGNENTLILSPCSKYPQKSISKPNATVNGDLASSNNNTHNEQNENKNCSVSGIQSDMLKALCKLRQALICKSQNYKKEKTGKCLEKSKTDKDIDVSSSSPTNCDTKNIQAHLYIGNPPLTSNIKTNTDIAESHDLNRIIDLEKSNEKSEVPYKQRRMKTLKKRRERVEIRNKLDFTNISISSSGSRQDKDRIKEKFENSADDLDLPSELPLSDLKRKLQKKNAQIEKRNSNLPLDDIKQVIPKRKLQREVEDLMAQEDYISNVSGYDVSLLNGESNRRSTEEEIVTFILKKYRKKVKRESNIPKSPAAEKLYTKDLSSPSEELVTTLKAQSLSCRVLQKINNNECIQPERSRRRQTVSTRNKNLNIITKEKNIFTRNENKRRLVNEKLTEERIIPETKKIKRKQRRESLLAETFNENISLEDASSAEGEEEAVSEETLIKLNDLSINIPWEVPPLHSIETIVTRAPLRHQQKRIKDLNLEIKKGAFDKMEDNKIKENWLEFCALHELPTNPTLFISGTPIEKIGSFSNTQRLQFVRFLAHGLENRLLHSVYMRFQRLFLKRKTGRFSREEDKIIMDYMKTTKSNRQFLDLSHILRRDKLAVEKRYICIKNRERCTKIIKWDKKTIANFLTNLLQVVKCSQIERLKTRQIKSKEWIELSQKLNIPPYKLRRVWRYTIYPRLFIEHSVNSKPIKRNLVDMLLEKNECDWRNLNWNLIAKKFKGFTGEKLYFMFKNMVKYHVPSAIQGNLHECLEYLQSLDFETCMYPCKKIKKLKVIQKNSI